MGAWGIRRTIVASWWSVQFRAQRREWKYTKVELRKILLQVYEDTRVLKEHIVSNQVTQEHLYALHIQVKRTAKQIRDASRGVDLLIGLALKQMSLNVDAVRDFGTVLRAIPFDTLSIHDFYRSIRSFYLGMMDRIVKKYDKNNPYIINIAHALEIFLQVCDFVEPLPGGLGQFTAMMTSILRDVYHVDLDLEDLRRTAREMKAEPSLSEEDVRQGGSGSWDGGRPALTQEKMKDVLAAVEEKAVSRKAAEQDAHYSAKVHRILGK